MKKILAMLGKILLIVLVLALTYVLILCYPQLFFKNRLILDNVTIYSDEEILKSEVSEIVKLSEERVKKSIIYKPGVRQNIFISNNPLMWKFFSNINYKSSGLNYVCFNHNIFFRKVDIKNNRLYGNSGKVASGDRTLDYFLAHEMTHTLEYQSMPWYKYPIHTNWTLEGYAEYIAHGSQNYEAANKYYLEVPENTGAKYYTRVRTMVTYLLEIEKIDIHDLWSRVGEYDSILKMAIPVDKPTIIDSI